MLVDLRSLFFSFQVTSHKSNRWQEAKWIQLHMDLCEQKGIPWPPPIPAALKKNQWFLSAPRREQEIICFASLEPGCVWVDASQTATRARNSKSESCPTLLPGCHLWHFPSGRFVTGKDMMRLQGFPTENMKGSPNHSDSQLADLAGNAFSSSVALAVDMALLLMVECSKPADDNAAVSEACHLLDTIAPAHGGSHNQTEELEFEFEI